jgi:hypothetical protein
MPEARFRDVAAATRRPHLEHDSSKGIGAMEYSAPLNSVTHARERAALAVVALVLSAGLAACAAPDEKGSWRDRPSSYSDYGGRPGVPSGGGP